MEKSIKRGLMLVLEGIDGSGKTTQARMLAKWLREKGKKVLLTHEPMRSTKLGRYIERRIRDKKNPPSKAELLGLFTRDRIVHTKNTIIPSMKKGRIVISDRYSYSTLAYQLPERKWKGYIEKFPFLKPDIALIFDVPEKTAMERINKSIKKDERRYKKKAIFEKENFLRKLRKKFLAMKRFPEVRIIDARPSPAEIFEKVKKELEKLQVKNENND